MFRYLTLITFTDKGATSVNESTVRAGSFGKAVQDAGGKLISQYWALGEVDGCVVFEAPDEETATGLLIGLAKDGNVRTRTTRVYNQSEFEAVVAKA